jgi:Na+/H+-dicarboxylate symporter
MDGTSVVLTLTVLFFAKTFGITLTPSDYVSMIFTVIVLSMGCPGIPGAGIVCASVLLRQFGIPLDALAMIVGLYSVIDPLTTADNVMGDMTGTYVIAKRSGLVRKTDM